MSPLRSVAVAASAHPPVSLTRLAVAALVAAAGCDAPGGTPAVGTYFPASPPPTRPADGLLERADLQAVVDRQVDRDADALVVHLSDADAAVRARAAFALGSVQAPGALPALEAALNDADAGVRRDAAFALGQSGSVTAVEPLAATFHEEADGAVRHRILEALGKVAAPEAADALLGLDVREGEEARRTLSLSRLMAVHGVRHEGALDHLLGHLDHAVGAVRQAAAYHFGRQPEPGVWAQHAPRVREALDGYALDDPAAMYLVQALGRVQAIFDEERLHRWATEAEDWRTRANAMTALAGRELYPATQDILFAALDDPSHHVGVSAAQTLARQQYPPPVLLRVRQWVEANPEDWQVAAPLLVLLARHDEREAVFAWVDALGDDADPYRVSAGLRALSYLAGAEVVDRVARAAALPTDWVAGEAAGGLVQRWTRDRADARTHAVYFEAFRRAVETGGRRVLFQAAPALADTLLLSLGNVDVLRDAYRRLDEAGDHESLVAVVGSLGMTGDPAALDVVREATRHSDGTVREAAANTLRQRAGEVVSVAPPGPRAVADPDPGVIDWAYLASLGPSPRLILETERGTVRIRLAPEEAPHTVQTLTRLAREGRYDGVPFHRVVPNFVVQGGDFAVGNGQGSPGFAITSEFTLIPFRRGVVGMASAGKDTEGSQFFMNHVFTPHLDGGYTAFGWVEEGMDAVDALAQGDRIVRASVEPS